MRTPQRACRRADAGKANTLLLLILMLLLLLIGLGFGYGYAQWQQAAAPSGAPASPAQTGTAPAAPAGGSGDAEHLMRVQESVLDSVATMNAQAKETLDFAILTVGFVGSLVLAVFAYFGLSTAREAKQVRTESEQLNGELRKMQQEFRKTREKFETSARESIERIDDTQERIVVDILGRVTPQLEQVTNYGMKIGEFAGNTFNEMSNEDRLRDCQEAAEALEAAHLGAGADRARSFILARQGVALLLAGRTVEAIEPLVAACECNSARKPDRPYNLACAYARLAGLSAPEAPVYKAKAIACLAQCLALGTPEKDTSTISKAYFLRKMRPGSPFSDADLVSLRGDPDFERLIAVAAPAQA